MARSAPPPPARPGDRVLVIAHSHLDVQWRWTVVDTITRFLPATVDAFADRAARFPDFVGSVDGVFRLALLRDHDPERFARLRELVRRGAWHVAGPLWEAADTLLPSPESLLRHILVGQDFLDRELGVEPRHALLPDCFGFPGTLPSILAHAGLGGFLTQKLRKGERIRAAAGIPFPVGWWEGPDGARVLAILDPGEYGDRLEGSVQDRSDVLARLAEQEERGAPRAVAMLVGVGDTGGAPDAETLRHLEASAARPEPPHVEAVASQEAIDRLAGGEGLPVWRDELLLSLHGTGCYTSRVDAKRWNAANERLAFAAEAAATVAWSEGLAPWPAEALAAAWERILWHQFHDDLTGTSVPAAYAFTWADEGAAAALLASTLEGSLERIAARLDTRGTGTPFVVWNPLPRARETLVELALPAELAGDDPGVRGPAGEPLPVQLLERGATVRLLTRVGVGGLGLAVVRVVPGEGGAVPAPAAGAAADPGGLDNGRLVARLDRLGRLASLRDRELDRELLAGPVEPHLLRHRSTRFPAWEIRRETLARRPGRPRTVGAPDVVEEGPLRATLAVRRRSRGLEITERLSVEAGGAVLRTSCEVLWQRRGSLLKVAFPLAAGDGPQAVYDAGWGAATRPPNGQRLWEVPAREWAALEGERGGVMVASADRHGWDRPDPATLRLTLVHSPATGPGRRFRHQGRLDHGSWTAEWAIGGYGGGWTHAGVAAAAEAWTRPLVALRTTSHRGPLGPTASWLEAPEDLAVFAVKRELRGSRPVVRVVDRSGAARTLTVRSGMLVGTPARLDARERPHPAAAEGIAVDGGEIRMKVEPWGARTVAFAPQSEPDPRGLPIGPAVDGGPSVSELELPTELVSAGVRFRTGALLGDARLETPGPGRLHLLACGRGGAGWLRIGDDAARVPDSLAPLALEGNPGRLGRRPSDPTFEPTPVAAVVPRRGPDGRRLPWAFATLFHLRLETGGGVLPLEVEGPVVVVAATWEPDPPPRLEPCRPWVDPNLARPRG